MKVLFIGGTGKISTACSRLALERAVDLTLLNRGRRHCIEGAREITVDIDDTAAVSAALGDESWDVVVDFISFSPDDLRRRVEWFRGRVGQFHFISSASCYQKPVTHYPVTESTPLDNPFWAYSRDKIACEEYLLSALREEAFPAVIIRPSFTYDHTMVPLSLNSWHAPYTLIDRMRRGAPIVVPGDGTSLWQLTHNSDFARGLLGLFGHPGVVGHALHITTDELVTWNMAYRALADAAGVAEPDLVHIASDFIVDCLPEHEGGLHGDKTESVILDNTKIKQFVPDYVATTRFIDGIRHSVEWYDADPARRVIDETFNDECDRLVAAYREGLASAKAVFGR
ncbi:NAD-dependent epimerase/dehydratase family protein [Marinihelvus fidelis]|uniref:NAD-dependent epimerase/dehydratase family protein n=1 Tax=Marinihelvus fidelis TaxID=2613842 RepID=A0A5N0TH85_9GAMM|nr:NAD-dependent epimerase/dehydratase family protein [Marinihelvus fidelis]KAA9132659.1 NAD-dependent epimerase/dehydratase family protein [Marinihelvus fidelis]